MKDRANRERPDEAQHPGNQQNDGDRIQHGDLSLANAGRLSTSRGRAIRESRRGPVSRNVCPVSVRLSTAAECRRQASFRPVAVIDSGRQARQGCARDASPARNAGARHLRSPTEDVDPARPHWRLFFRHDQRSALLLVIAAAVPTRSSSRFSAIPKRPPGNSSISPNMAASTPLTRAMPSPIDMTDPTSDTRPTHSSAPSRARIAVEINSACTHRSWHALRAVSVLSGTGGRASSGCAE